MKSKIPFSIPVIASRFKKSFIENKRIHVALICLLLFMFPGFAHSVKDIDYFLQQKPQR